MNTQAYLKYIFSFPGDKWGEVDTRFSFCAVMCLSLLHRLDAIDVNKAIDFVTSCMNFDGGFGSKPGSESHAGNNHVILQKKLLRFKNCLAQGANV